MLARGEKDVNDIFGEFVGRLTTAFLVASLVGGAMLLVGSISPAAFAIVLAVAVGSQLAQCAQVPLLGSGKYGTVAAANIVDKLVFALITGALVAVQQLDPLTYSVSYVAGNVLGGTLAIWHWRLLLPRCVPTFSPRRMWKLYRSSHWVGWAQVSFSAQQLDIPVARLASTDMITGQYGAVARWTQPIVLLASAAATTTLRDSASADTDDAAIRRVQKRVRVPFALACITSGVAAMLAFVAAPIVLGQAYSDARFPAVVLLMSAPFAFLNQVLVNLLVGRHHEKPAGLGAALLVTAQLVAVYPLTKLLGPVGPAASTFGMQMIYCSVLLRATATYARHSGEEFHNCSVLKRAVPTKRNRRLL
ncbi:MATE family efflux transporter [Flexivirga lutea]